MRRIFIIFCFVALLLSLNGKQVQFDGLLYDEGLNVTSQSPAGVELSYSLKGFDISDIEINGKVWDQIVVAGKLLPGAEGRPDVPNISTYIALPQGARASVKIVDYRTETFTGLDIAPAPRIPLETEDGLEYPIDSVIYESSSYYPADQLVIGDNDLVRGVDCMPIAINTFRYNPVTQELLVVRDIKLEITFTGGNGHFGEDRLRSRWWEPINTSFFINHESLAEVDFNRQSQHRTLDYEYLIICPDDGDFITWADTIAVFRNKQGIRSGVVTTSDIGANTYTAIQNYINDAYNDWDIPPVAFLLLGDYGSAGATITSPMWNNYCVSDLIYADVNNNDMPDMAHARITARNVDELETMINKALDYEVNPPTNPGFYDNPVSAGGWQTERWFILCSEAVYGFWANELGKEPIREYAIYAGTPGTVWSTATNTATVVNYFGPNGLGYIPATPNVITDWGANATRVNQDINNGCFMIQHRDHGGEDGWGEPSYSNNNLNALENEDLTFVFSINCLTGKYNWGQECFTEAFHRHSQGALGLIAASEVSYSFVNDTYTWGMYDYMWPNFMPDYGEEGEEMLLPCFANGYGKYFLQQSDWPYNTDNKEVTYNLFHHHGDAFTRLYSEVPQDLTVMHDPVLVSGANFFTVSVDVGALICLSIDGEILATAVGIGEPQTITVEPQMPMNTMDIVITKQNFYRYDTSVLIIPPDGAYIVYNDVEVDDTAGNDNGQADYDETILLDLTFENIGNDEGIDVVATISCEDDYIDITEPESLVGMVPGDTLWTMQDAFELAIADDIPDQHRVLFTLNVTDTNNEYWTSYFSMDFNAPQLVASGYLIDDLEFGNGDGIFDAGETIDFIITTENQGHSLSPDAISSIFCSNLDITIDNYSYPLGEIAVDEPVNAIYTITADSSMHVGTQIVLNYSVDASNYSINRDFRTSIGITSEDFESGDFSSFDWTFEGDEDWMIDTEHQEGEYSACSGDVMDNQNSALVMEVDFLSDATLSFFKMISSENGFDYLRFYIDDELMDEWSGNVDWSEESYYVRYGSHTLKWDYQKDGGTSSGDDCAWVDYIIFPPIGTPAPPVLHVDPIMLNLEADQYSILEEPIELSNIGGGTILYSVRTENPTTRNVEECYITNSTTIFEPGETTTWSFTIYNNSEDNEWVQGLSIQFPEGVVVEDANNFYITNDRVLEWDETVGNGALLNWFGVTQAGYGVLRSGEFVSANVDVTISENFTGVMQLDYSIFGDGYGYEPHEAYGILELTYPLSWIALDLQNGALNSNETDPVMISIDATDLEEGTYLCDIVISSEDIYADVHLPVTLEVVFTDEDQDVIPEVTKLLGCHPNPFNPETTISFQISDPAQVKLQIYNVRGQLVKTLVNDLQQPGHYDVIWNGLDSNNQSVSSGVYFYKMQADNIQQTNKMLLLK
ncbi:MAG: C25 family cysteine peptidase [Candidatus Stygibacter australis]|nr:C25 family cysteine peptidase [Candidatus Stygibacter australis]MDP8323397.1 C25 family cysteine peptidase [Candidatus Stygibacter australis]